jgi:hypothetical protein
MTERQLDEATLRFGPYRLHFHARPHGLPFVISAGMEAFLTENSGPVTLDVAVSKGTIRSPSSAPDFTERAWDLWKLPDGGEEICFRYGLNHTVPNYLLRTDASYSQASLIEAGSWRPDVSMVIGGPLPEYLVARLVGRHGGLKLHAATAVFEGRAHVFVGHSGAGKSTISELAEQAGATIPTDDRTIITLANDDGAGGAAATAWGTPWHGNLPRKSPEGFPIAGVYILRQAPENRLGALSSGAAVNELFVRLIQPRLDPREVSNTYRTLERLVASVPVQELHFRREREALALLW